MKTNLWGLVPLFLSVVSTVSAGDTYAFVEQQGVATRVEGGDQTQTVGWGQYDLTKQTGVFAWGQRVASKGGYQQGYVGLSRRFGSSFQAGVGGGVERGSDGQGGRIAGFALITRGKNLGFLIREDGVTGPWNYVLYNRSIGNGRFGIGAIHQSFVGTGPRFEINLGQRKRWKPWVSVHAHKDGGPNVQFGFRWTYASE